MIQDTKQTTQKEDTVSEPEQTDEVSLSSEEKAEQAKSVIKKSVYAAAGVGLVPIPWVDFAGLTAIQIKMLHSLSKIHGVEFSESKGKSITASLISGYMPIALIQPVASFIKSIPVIGQITGALTMSILGGSTAYAIGRVFNMHFASGGTFFDFDVEKMRHHFEEQFEEGKKMTAQARKKATT
jgi:uncharacterized protein (DUF697 family)